MKDKLHLEGLEENFGHLNPYDAKTKDEITSTINNLKNFTKLSGEDFKDTVKRIHRIGVRDYDLRRAIQYRENYYKALEGIKNYKNYDKFKKRLDRFKNPVNFYKFIQRSGYMSSLFVFYKRGSGLVIGNFATNEDAFDYALQNDYGIEVE